MKNHKKYIALLTLIYASWIYASADTESKNNSNQFIYSFSKAKKLLERKVYFDHRKSFYCNANFNSDKKVVFPKGFKTTKYMKRAKKIEWEHVVPAENFGRAFTEWRDGHPGCVNKKGKAFKGRKCASKTNQEYRLMQADLYNLYPAIGAVNALRSNYNFTLLPDQESDFGSCNMKIENSKAEPPKNSRGRIARTYLYMDVTYSKYRMSKQQKNLMTAWSQQYPVDKWECERAKRIESIQQNDNIIVKSECIESGIW